MKKISYFLLLTLVLVSCGTDSNHFKIAGRFLNLNQGEFYVYSIDGGSAAIDTIKVQGGRFSREIECRTPQTFMLVFPNFSEQPVFADPGKSVDIKANASHLKEMEVTGTKDNESMTAFRQRIANVSPPEAKQLAAQFIKDNPASRVSNFLLRRYFVAAPQPDYQQAKRLIEPLLKEQKDNIMLSRLSKQLNELCAADLNGSLPDFSTVDAKGRSVSKADFNGKVGLVYVWSTWNYESMGVLRQLKTVYRQNPGKLQIMGICIDAAKRDCNSSTDRDSIAWPNVCDGLLFEGPLIGKLGMRGINDNIVVSKTGRVVAHGLGSKEMIEELKRQLAK